ncbi:hypothetical protein CFC21_102520 [Triticum aestivum]|uniref:Chorismate mutase n=3 Tax=Triticum TaxID=4564 RepID=A0A9R0ZY74_TRITD|nr:chorismate mutase 2, cytosolic-like [Triticum dicoccoides]XP_044434769.1 chorismate mutase 2, cytosolic-like [Triticum aestivum]KAF7101123.1 hypothetical protein CFC21_102520 [Triticum aestivum]VAI86256.1 unnamed protein product [Triticum turgidum subsp. durum]
MSLLHGLLSTPMAAPSLYAYLLSCNVIALLLVVAPPCAGLGLDTVRGFLTREEDTVIFSLIERAKHPMNLPAYDDRACFGPAGRHGRRNGSFVELFVRESEQIQAKAGRYQSQQEVPFFQSRVPFTLAPPYNFTTDLHPGAASVNVNDAIWGMYFSELLPQLANNGSDDGNYAVTAASDLACLQALSRRINYGRYVAEVKFRGDQQRYTALIRSKDKDALMKLLTSEAQEDVVKRRVEKKAMVFGQDVTLNGPTETGDDTSSQSSFKVAPSVVYELYDRWVIPLTKQVEIEYLLHRLD